MSLFRKEYRLLTDAEKFQIESIKSLAEEMVAAMEVYSSSFTPSQERAIALAMTKLEESVMWAVKGITE